MTIRKYLIAARAFSATRSIGRTIEALVDFRNALRIDDPMREAIEKSIIALNELYDEIEEYRKEQNND